MSHALALRVGPIGYRIIADWPGPIAQLADVYRDYPDPCDGIPDFTVRLHADRPWRRWLRPSVTIGGDHVLPGAAPLPLAHGLLAGEMAMNLQLALGWRRHLLLHAAVVGRGGRALLMTGESGSGKSTLSVLLAAGGWRFMGDEFALLGTGTGTAHPFPRPVSLKNEGIAAASKALPGGRFGPLLRATPKGDVRHLAPDTAAIRMMDVPAMPALILFPRFGAAAAVRPVARSEAFVRLTHASTNYVMLGEPGFAALTSLVAGVPAVAIDYPDSTTAVEQVEALWAGL